MFTIQFLWNILCCFFWYISQCFSIFRQIPLSKSTYAGRSLSHCFLESALQNSDCAASPGSIVGHASSDQFLGSQTAHSYCTLQSWMSRCCRGGCFISESILDHCISTVILSGSAGSSRKNPRWCALLALFAWFALGVDDFRPMTNWGGPAPSRRGHQLLGRPAKGGLAQWSLRRWYVKTGIFSLWTLLQNFEIMIISRTALRPVEILAVDTAAKFLLD